MPRLSVPFGEWLPDLPGPRGQALAEAENVIPLANGYGPVAGPVATTAALPARVLGAAAFRSGDGQVSIMAGTASSLYRLAGGVWEQVGTGYSGGSQTPWFFVQFGDRAIASNGVDLPVWMDLATPGPVSVLSGAPRFQLSTVVLDFIVTANVAGRNDRVQWSGINNSEEWRPGFGQSDYNSAAEGGAITGLAGGRYGLVLQEERTTRMEYVGGNTIFQFTPIDRETGCIHPRSVAALGRLAFFLSARGFMFCDGSQVVPIGDQKVDRTFLLAMERGRLYNMSAAIDPVRKLVAWSLPDEEPELVYVYSYTLQRWATVRTAARFLFVARKPPLTIGEDHLPTMPADGFIGSGLPFGDPEFQGGGLSLGVFGADNALYEFTGPTLAARLLTGDVDLAVSGRAARLRRVLPLSDAASGVSFLLQKRAKYGAAPVETAFTGARGDGSIPARSEARHARVGLGIAAGVPWTFAQGLEIEAETGSGR